MNCRKCGAEISGEPLFCHECGIIKPLDYNLNNSESKEKRYCPNCGTEFDHSDGRCPICKTDKNDVIFRDTELEEYVQCSHCGKKIKRGDSYCFYCGTELFDKNGKANTEKAEFKMEVPESVNSKPKTETGYSDNSGYPIPNTTLWLVLGIVSLVGCCTLTSIGTIICSMQAAGSVNTGNLYLANKKIRAAKIWFFAGIILRVVLISAIYISALL
ncbi:MAG: zinc-ribbon domain-containing protein [Oscillospiraceae bacterium]|nr:zinc-ribbon domain-containing protein [Oscillospiraceae bacterium]